MIRTRGGIRKDHRIFEHDDMAQVCFVVSQRADANAPPRPRNEAATNYHVHPTAQRGGGGDDRSARRVSRGRSRRRSRRSRHSRTIVFVYPMSLRPQAFKVTVSHIDRSICGRNGTGTSFRIRSFAATICLNAADGCAWKLCALRRTGRRARCRCWCTKAVWWQQQMMHVEKVCCPASSIRIPPSNERHVDAAQHAVGLRGAHFIRAATMEQLWA